MGDALIQSVLPDGSIGGTVSVTNATSDATTRTITFGLPISLPDGNYRATLLAGSVADAYGSSPTSNYSFDFFSLAGDANHDRSVDLRDLYALATNWQGTGKTFGQGDFNYDGVVDSADLGILATHWQATLAAPLPAVPVSTVLTPARRTATRVITLIQ